MRYNNTGESPPPMEREVNPAEAAIAIGKIFGNLGKLESLTVNGEETAAFKRDMGATFGRAIAELNTAAKTGNKSAELKPNTTPVKHSPTIPAPISKGGKRIIVGGKKPIAVTKPQPTVTASPPVHTPIDFDDMFSGEDVSIPEDTTDFTEVAVEQTEFDDGLIDSPSVSSGIESDETEQPVEQMELDFSVNGDTLLKELSDNTAILRDIKSVLTEIRDMLKEERRFRECAKE